MVRAIGGIVEGSATIRFVVGGSKVRLEFEGIVDTGFTGFVLLPIARAVPLGLEIDGLSSFESADGAGHQWPTATATAEFGDLASEGAVVLAYYGEEILIGMNFLKRFHLSLLIHRNQAILIDEPDLDPILPGLH